jgi:hypothetical protein
MHSRRPTTDAVQSNEQMSEQTDAHHWPVQTGDADLAGKPVIRC